MRNSSHFVAAPAATGAVNTLGGRCSQPQAEHFALLLCITKLARSRFAKPLHLGLRAATRAVAHVFAALRALGVSHVPFILSWAGKYRRPVGRGA